MENYGCHSSLIVYDYKCGNSLIRLLYLIYTIKLIPILSHQIINDMILIYGKHDFHNATFEFAYELMKRFNPKMLEIPLVGMQIPQHPVPAFSSVRASKMMPSIEAEAFFDENLTRYLLNKLEFNPKREVTIENILSDKRKRRIIMDYASLSK